MAVVPNEAMQRNGGERAVVRISLITHGFPTFFVNHLVARTLPLRAPTPFDASSVDPVVVVVVPRPGQSNGTHGDNAKLISGRLDKPDSVRSIIQRYIGYVRPGGERARAVRTRTLLSALCCPKVIKKFAKI